jgi:hypothetical protein
MLYRAAFLAVFALGAAHDCGADDAANGANAPCTRTKDCGAGLVCDEGVCRSPDAGQAPDAAPEASEPGDAADDGG